MVNEEPQHKNSTSELQSTSSPSTSSSPRHSSSSFDCATMALGLSISRYSLSIPSESYQQGC